MAALNSEGKVIDSDIIHRKSGKLKIVYNMMENILVKKELTKNKDYVRYEMTKYISRVLKVLPLTCMR